MDGEKVRINPLEEQIKAQISEIPMADSLLKIFYSNIDPKTIAAKEFPKFNPEFKDFTIEGKSKLNDLNFSLDLNPLDYPEKATLTVVDAKNGNYFGLSAGIFKKGEMLTYAIYLTDYDYLKFPSKLSAFLAKVCKTIDEMYQKQQPSFNKEDNLRPKPLRQKVIWP